MCCTASTAAAFKKIWPRSCTHKSRHAAVLLGILHLSKQCSRHATRVKHRATLSCACPASRPYIRKACAVTALNAVQCGTFIAVCSGSMLQVLMLQVLTRNSRARSCGMAPASFTLPARRSCAIICSSSPRLGPSPPATRHACRQHVGMAEIQSKLSAALSSAPADRTWAHHCLQCDRALVRNMSAHKQPGHCKHGRVSHCSDSAFR
jgi:hypothetical protein